MVKLRVLDLFSGIGGFSLGLEWAGMETVAFCEIDEFAARVLHKHWPKTPIHKDVNKLNYKEGDADVVCGGFPCQDISNAGKRAGITAPRSGLWRALVQTIRLVRPKYAIVENVEALLGRGMGTVLGDLAQGGYDAEWDCIPARAVGAPHLRQRVFIIAYNGCERIQRLFPKKIYWEQTFSWLKNVRGIADLRGRPNIPKPLIRRNGHGVSDWVDRLRCLGNSVVPQIIKQIGESILKHGEEKTNTN